MSLAMFVRLSLRLKERETKREEYGVCVCIGYCLEIEDYRVCFGEK